MTEEELARWKEQYGHLTQATMDNSANLRFTSCDADLDLGRLFTSQKRGDCVWFILTDESSSYPLQRLCILICTPDIIMCEIHNAGKSPDMSLLDSSCQSYLEHLKTIGYRKLTEEEYTTLTRRSS